MMPKVNIVIVVGLMIVGYIPNSKMLGICDSFI